MLGGDAAYSYRRTRDWQFFASGVDARLTLVDIAVPFGHDETGGMMSDHVGYVAQFRLDRLAQQQSGALTMPGRLKT